MRSNEYKQIRSLVDSANQVLKNCRINYNSLVGPLTKKLIELSNQLKLIINQDYPQIAFLLEEATKTIVERKPISQYPYGPTIINDYINAYSFGDIRTIIKILDVLYPLEEHNTYKLFISHSSEDESIINCFIEKVLMLGCGFKRTDIFCTLDHTVIRTGDDFRNEIIENMKSCDYILCMISNDYRKSEVCQNEMGAAWTFNDKRILPFKFPNISFSEVGFLNVVKQAADITDKAKLDELYDELCKYYDLQPDWRNFNKQKDDFVDMVNSKQINNIELV